MNKLESKPKLIERKLLTDSRGWFLKVIDGNEEGNPFACEVYITSAKPGDSKGGHYHLNAQEWFTLISGEALLTTINVATLEKSEIILSEFNPQSIYVPPGIAHNFLNVGAKDYILLAYTDLIYTPSDTIIYNF